MQGIFILLAQAALLLPQSSTEISLSLVTERGYPSICALKKLQPQGFCHCMSTSTAANKVRHCNENPKAEILCCTQQNGVIRNGVSAAVTDETEKQALCRTELSRTFSGGASDPRKLPAQVVANQASVYIEDAFAASLYGKEDTTV